LRGVSAQGNLFAFQHDEEAHMHAVVISVELDPKRADEARELLESFTIPMAKAAPGFISGRWMRSADAASGRGVVILDSEDAANGLATRAAQGPPEGAPAKFVSAEVFEVLAEA
jgi:hypothetical protein